MVGRAAGPDVRASGPDAKVDVRVSGPGEGPMSAFVRWRATLLFKTRNEKNKMSALVRLFGPDVRGFGAARGRCPPIWAAQGRPMSAVLGPMVYLSSA